MNFRGHEFKTVPGTVHPQYSHDTFTIEEHDFRERYWNPQPGDVVVDAGASYGSYTLTALACGADVWAFEPEPTVMVDLERNVRENGWQNRCDLHTCGLWDKDAVVDMRSYAQHWPEDTITDPFDMKRLDDVFTGDRLDWLKIDTEGAEERVVRGALDTIRKHKPKMIVECHVFLEADMVQKIRALLPEYEWIEEPRDPCVLLVGNWKPAEAA